MKQYKYKINGNSYDVTINTIEGELAQVEVNGIPFEVQMLGAQLSEESLPEVEIVSENNSNSSSSTDSITTETNAPTISPTGAGEGSATKAPLPGVVTKIQVAVGQSVKKGENILILEAMKMENNITADSDGVISGIAVKPGDSVLEGDILFTIK